MTSKRIKAYSLVGDVSTPKKKRVDGSFDQMVTTFMHYPSSLAGVWKRSLWFQTTPQAIALMPVLFFDVSPDATNLARGINPPFWTLTVEWQFYLLLPWIALGLTKFAGSRTGLSLLLRLSYGLGFLIAIGLALRVLAAIAHYTSGQDDPGAAPGLLGALVPIFFGARGKQLDVFALGMSASLFYVWAIEQGHLPDAYQRLIGQFALILSILGLTASFWWASLVGRVPDLATTYLPQGQIWAVLGEWSLGVCFVLLLIAVLFGPSRLGSLFSLRPLRYIGTISYSLYVWHWPLLFFCLGAFIPLTPGTFGPPVLMASLAIFIIGSASYFLIERPFLPWRHVPRSQMASRVQLS